MGSSPLGIIGSLAGGILGQRSASRMSDALNAANYANREGFEMAKPYIKRLYSEGSDALDDILNTGYYQGATYAGLNDNQRRAANLLSSFGMNNYGLGQQMMDTSGGFGQNYADIFNKARAGGMASAQDYAMNNSQPLVDAAMRDSTRQLYEATLPSLNRQASASLNTNSSRAGVADALARRSYNDRRADVTADIQDKLMGRSLTQFNRDITNQMSANDALKNTFGIGFNLAPAALGYVGKGEGILQDNAQKELNAARDFFEGNRDFRYNALNSFGSGILGQAPRSPSFQQTPNYFDPLMSGLGGAMQGFGFGNNLNSLFASQTNLPMSGLGSLRGYFSS